MILDVLDEATFIVSKIASCMGKQCRTGGPLLWSTAMLTLFQNTPLWTGCLQASGTCKPKNCWNDAVFMFWALCHGHSLHAGRIGCPSNCVLLLASGQRWPLRALRMLQSLSIRPYVCNLNLNGFRTAKLTLTFAVETREQCTVQVRLTFAWRCTWTYHDDRSQSVRSYRAS